MNPVYGRSFSVFPFIDEEHREESDKLVERDFTPFYSDSYYDDNPYGAEEEYYYHRPRTADNYYGIRQAYLRSYTFTREEPAKPKKDAVKRFKAIVWAVLCLNFKISKAKMLRAKLGSRSSRFIHGSSRFIHDSTDYISSSCRKIAVPNCVRFSSLEVA